MRIVVDLQGAQTASRHRGIGRYSMALAQAVARNAGAHDVWVALNASFEATIPDLRAAFDTLLPATRIVRFDVPPGTAWNEPSHRWRRDISERLREGFLRDLEPDFVHVSSLFEGTADSAITSVGLLPSVMRTGVTLYDLIPLHKPDEYLRAGWVRDWYYSKIESLKRADVLLAISGHAREEAIQTLGLSPERVVNISSAVSPDFRPMEVTPAERSRLRAVYSIDKPYVMYSGAMDPRKNVEALMKAFAALPDGMAGRYQLVIAGKIADADLERLKAAARKFQVEDRTVFTGYVSDADLILLYNAANLYVFPSLHEGFGLPALEAMACGVATIGSNTTSVPEVIGRADAMFDPTSVDAIAHLMGRALGDGDYHRSLREHALRHAATFSWDASAKRLIQAFEATAERSKSRAAWTSVREDISLRYRELIAAVAAVPRDASEATEGDRIAVARTLASNQEEAVHAARTSTPLEAGFTWRVEGPFDSSYSLALVNREVALALSKDGIEVALHSTEGPGDFPANPEFLKARPDLAELHRRTATITPGDADVSSRLLYPPRVADMTSRFNLLHTYAWEESGFPPEWVDAFNESLQGLSTLSTHVRKIMIDNGVSVPISLGMAGIDHWDRVTAEDGYRVDGKSFRFLHVSSCFPRKGADVLLKAFGQAFTAADDVSLIIKTFANPHNEVHTWLREAKGDRTDFPDVRIIEEDLSDERLKALYAQCHALVAPSRAEGFGLPLAEAMISGLAVITTAWGGQTDFCSPETAWLVDYDFAEAKTHFNLFHSVWAEPLLASLAQAMREVWSVDPETRAERVRRGQDLLREKFKWSDVSERMIGFVRWLSNSPRTRPPRIGWVSTWNKRCGIASYSAHLVGHMPTTGLQVFASTSAELTAPDGGNVVRCWDADAPDHLFGLSNAVAQACPDIVVIQFQYGFFEFPALSRFMLEQKHAGRVVVAMLHATQDPAHVPTRKLSMLAQALRQCDRVLVHGIADLNRLKALGVVDNAAIVPHGIPSFAHDTAGPKAPRFRVASYGFCLPHKGLPQLLEAVAELIRQGKDIELLMLNAEYPVGESAELARSLAAHIKELGVEDRINLVTDYLSDGESFRQLSTADLIVFPYQETGESSSAAVRYGLAVGRPVAVTPISIFDDVGGAVYRLPGTTVEQMAIGLAGIIDGHPAAATIAATADRWREAHQYTTLGRRLYNMLFALYANHPGVLTGSASDEAARSLVSTRKI
ncbi:glycosyltransferase [Dyella halodurans]|uniref:Glycosyltransferase n=2 Tax=Dyella halodurans TaxID=1920171 RepID=A0ABV9BXB6_9GAMM|nr:glycosyltransferase [Dyella halodurans]